jgi:4-amino-4-deoxy-L-arabinose transferase-like glycosyltransferase
MSEFRKKWLVFLALLLVAAGALRVAVARYLPNDDPDDGRVYAQIARNVLEQHVYSHATEPPYDPSLIRLPGYPLFLTAIYAVFGHTNNGAVRIVQALIDTATCALVALLAFYWQPDEKRKRATAIAALCLAAVCPFTTIYAATILTEVPTMFLAVAMCVAATLGFESLDDGNSVFSVSPWLIFSKNRFTTETQRTRRIQVRRSTIWWCVAGILGGLAVLLRPDSGLFAAAVGITLLLSGVRRFWSAPAERRGDGALDLFPSPTGRGVRGGGANAQALTPTLPQRGREPDIKSSVALRLPPHSITRTVAAGVVFSLAFALVLVPWTIRNARVFHLFQPLAPAHGEMPDEFVSRGYFAWLRTWLDDERDIGPFLWSLDTEAIKLDKIPPQAFDSDDEKSRVAALLEKYNHPPDTESENTNTAPSQPQPTASPSPATSPPPSSVETAGGEDNQREETDQSDKGDNSDESDQAQEPQSVEMTPEVDAGFAQIARERIARHPIRYYAWLPVKRAGTMWFNTHSQYWPWDGELFPLDELDHDTHQQYWLPIFAGLTWIYTLLGLVGGCLLWRARKSSARRWLLLASLVIFLRLGFFSMLENPEPRYVVEFFPFLAALGGIAVVRLVPISFHPVRGEMFIDREPKTLPAPFGGAECA